MKFIYLFIVISWLGILTIYFHRFVRRWDGEQDLLLCVLMSAALLPHLLGFVSLLSFLLLPSPGIWHYFLSLGLAASALFMLDLKKKGELFECAWVDIDWRVWSVPILATLLVFPVLIEKIDVNFSVPLYAHDSLIYANEARILVEGGALTDIPWFGGRFDESVTVNHAHGPLFTSFLAQALLAGDDIIRLAFQGTLVCMLTGVAALGRATGRPWAGTAAVLGFLTVPTVCYVSEASSRDGFRIAPLLVMIVMMLCQAQQNERRSGDSFNLSLAAIATGMSHALNLIYLPIIGVVGLLAGWMYRKNWRSLLQWLWLPVLALLLVSLPYWANLYFYNHPLGLGVYYPMYQGTALWDEFASVGNWGKSLSISDSFIHIQHSYGAIQTWGLLSGLVICMAFGWKYRRIDQLFWLGLLVMLITLGPVFLITDAEGVSLASAFSSNLRYPMAGYAFLGLAIYLPVDLLLRLLKRYIDCSTIVTFGLACFLIGGAYLARMQVGSWSDGAFATEYLEEGEWQLVKIARAMPLKGGAWYTNSFSPAYYATGIDQPKLFFTRESRPLLTAKSVSEVVEEFIGRRIGMVSLYQSSAWENTLLYKVLFNCHDVEYLELPRWKVFIIEPKFGLESCRDKILFTEKD